MDKYTDKSYSLYPATGGGRGFKVEDKMVDGRIYRSADGWVETPQGFVRAYSSFFGNKYQSSYLEIIKKNGRTYSRRFDKEYTARGLVTKAKQFAKNIHC